MSELKIFNKQLDFQTAGNKATYFKIGKDCQEFIASTGIENGIIIIQSPHTTCGIIFEEMVHDKDALGDEFLQADLNKGLDRVFPKQTEFDDYYKYPGIKHREFGDNISNSDFSKNHAILLNADAHLKATLIGSCKTLIIKDKVLLTGTYGNIYFVDFDTNRPRSRHCNLCIIGV